MELLKNRKIKNILKILFGDISEKIRELIIKDVDEFKSKSKDEIVNERYEKFRKMGC